MIGDLHLEFDVGERVRIDGCEGGVVTAITIRKAPIGYVQMYEVSWLANGDQKVATVEEWRLSK